MLKTQTNKHFTSTHNGSAPQILPLKFLCCSQCYGIFPTNKSLSDLQQMLATYIHFLKLLLQECPVFPRQTFKICKVEVENWLQIFAEFKMVHMMKNGLQPILVLHVRSGPTPPGGRGGHSPPPHPTFLRSKKF